MYRYETDETLLERRQLVRSRIDEIVSETGGDTDPLARYRHRTGRFLQMMGQLDDQLRSGESEHWSLEQWQQINHRMYEDILPEHYADSFASPACAAAHLGPELGRLLSFAASQMRTLTGSVFEGLDEITLIHMELFSQICSILESGMDDPLRELREAIYWFVSDYTDVLLTERIRQNVDPSRDFAIRLVRESDLSDPRYLYTYGEYVSENELQAARYLAGLSEDEIERIARTFTEGYRIGFVKGGKDLSRKRSVSIQYHLGFERVIRRSMERFADLGLESVLQRQPLSRINIRSIRKAGYAGADANPQYNQDHQDDAALYLDRKYVERYLEVMKTAYETYKTEANGMAGPAVLEVFGEEPFSPAACPAACRLSASQQKLKTQMNQEASRLTNQYIIGEERSFTIMAFPLPSIAGSEDEYHRIFADTLEINTLDSDIYEQIQQHIIDALDRGRFVEVCGSEGNRTRLKVALMPLTDPKTQTIFENCTADVNIPVGEVFTSPQLSGTEGTLHVSGVYLNGLYFKDLELQFSDGMICDYRCANFDDPEENRAYIQANILFHHETLPMGEFAIGTNTRAYRMAREYGIGGRLPILIAEKTGPHFAVGDTCYSYQEDTPVCNADGKEIIARDNEVSLLRRTDPSRAYFGCHTDITIPYSELGSLTVYGEDGYEQTIIRDGRFVLPGTEPLNEAL